MRITLQQLFDSKRADLVEKCSGLSLPSDTQLLQKVVIDYFNEVFDENGDFRQSLTQSEDYILQAAISLLNAQREMAESIKVKSGLLNVVPVQVTDESIEPNDDQIEQKSFFEKPNPELLIGSGAGALLGKVICGGWGAVFGAIAGTAIAIYLSTNDQPKSKDTCKVLYKDRPVESSPLDVEKFVSTIESICKSVDNLLDSFRAQIRSVMNKYESQPKPSLDTDYLPLLESIQSLIGYERTHSEIEEKYCRKLKERIEDVGDVLGSWNLSFVNFDGENSQLFDLIPSEKATEDKMVYPAILKGDSVIAKGKVFTKVQVEL